jgi:uncharacterized protein YecT (DUF1311 family)
MEKQPMDRLPGVLTTALFSLAFFACDLSAAHQTPTMSGATVATAVGANDSAETINGIGIMPGAERLSYISLRYYGVRPSYDACIQAAQGHMGLKGDCADTEFQFQDARLNKAYRALLASITATEGEDATKDIQAAQRAWLAFYQKDCPAKADRFGSTPGPSTLSTCQMEKTAMRAQELEDWRNSYMTSHRP